MSKFSENIFILTKMTIFPAACQYLENLSALTLSWWLRWLDSGHRGVWRVTEGGEHWPELTWSREETLRRGETSGARGMTQGFSGFFQFSICLKQKWAASIELQITNTHICIFNLYHVYLKLTWPAGQREPCGEGLYNYPQYLQKKEDLHGAQMSVNIEASGQWAVTWSTIYTYVIAVIDK